MGKDASGYGASQDPSEANLDVHGRHVYPWLLSHFGWPGVSFLIDDVLQMGEVASGYGASHDFGGADLGVHDGRCPGRLGLIPTLQVYKGV